MSAIVASYVYNGNRLCEPVAMSLDPRSPCARDWELVCSTKCADNSFYIVSMPENDAY